MKLAKKDSSLIAMDAVSGLSMTDATRALSIKMALAVVALFWLAEHSDSQIPPASFDGAPANPANWRPQLKAGTLTQSTRRRNRLDYEQELKAMAERSCGEQANCTTPAEPYPQTTSGLAGAYYGDTCKAPYTLRQEAEERVGHHRSQAEKADSAAAFFRENPAFDEFIRLVRSGTIQF